MQSPVLAELDHDMPPEAGSLVTLGLLTEDNHDMVQVVLQPSGDPEDHEPAAAAAEAAAEATAAAAAAAVSPPPSPCLFRLLRREQERLLLEEEVLRLSTEKEDAEARATRELQARQELTEQLEQLVPELTAAVALLKQPSALAHMWALLLVIFTTASKALRQGASAGGMLLWALLCTAHAAAYTSCTATAALSSAAAPHIIATCSAGVLACQQATSLAASLHSATASTVASASTSTALGFLRACAAARRHATAGSTAAAGAWRSDVASVARNRAFYTGVMLGALAATTLLTFTSLNSPGPFTPGHAKAGLGATNSSSHAGNVACALVTPTSAQEPAHPATPHKVVAAASSPTPPARLPASLIAAPTSHSTTIATSKPASSPKELAVRPAAAALSAVTTSNRWTAAKPPNAGGPLKAYFKQVDWGAVTTTANAAIDAFSTASSSAGRAAAELAAKGGRRWQALLGRAAAVHPSLPSIIQCGADWALGFTAVHILY